MRAHGFGFDHDDHLLTPAAQDRARRSGSALGPIGFNLAI
jgi:hypothetical protein